MKVYIFHDTNEEALKMMDLLRQTARQTPEIELLEIVHDEEYEDCEFGNLKGKGHKKLCLQSHVSKIDIIKKHIGENIAFMDVDCLFNQNKGNEFARTINELLSGDIDFLFQYDFNEKMLHRFNMGIIGVKCSEVTYQVWKEYCENVAEIEQDKRSEAFPQMEWNERTHGLEKKYKYRSAHLPMSFGHRDHDPVVYHAIGSNDKLKDMKEMFEAFNS